MEEFTSKIIDGPYRFMLTIVLFIQMSNCNIIGQLFPFFFLDPIVQCGEEFIDSLTGLCNLNKMCQKNTVLIIDTTQTLANWSSEMNLYCPKSSYKLIVTTIYFVSSAIAPLFISKLPDRYGRMKVFNVLMIIMLISFIMLLFNSIFIHIVSMFITGGLLIIYNIEMQIITEYYSRNSRGFVTGVICASIPFFGTISILLFYYFKTIRCLWWLLIISQAMCIAIINMYFIESPIWLISMNRFEDSLVQMKKAAIINNKLDDYKEFVQITQSISQNVFNPKKNENYNNAKETYSFKDVIGFASLRKIIFGIGPYWIAVLLFDYTVFLNLERAHKNIYLQGIIIFLSCTVAAIIAGYLADLLGRKIMLILSVLFSVIPYVFTPLANQNGYFYTEAFLLFLSCIAIETAFTVIIIYVAEVLPTTIRSTASGSLYLFSRFGAICAPFVVFFFDSPQYFVSIILLLSIYFVWDLPETKGKELSSDVEENLLSTKNKSIRQKDIELE